MKKQAYTFIEMLMVILIISVIAALIFPIFLLARRSASATVGASNITQYGKSIFLYSTDFDDYPPQYYDRTLRSESDLVTVEDVLENYGMREALFKDPLDQSNSVGHLAWYAEYSTSYNYFYYGEHQISSLSVRSECMLLSDIEPDRNSGFYKVVLGSGGLLRLDHSTKTDLWECKF